MINAAAVAQRGTAGAGPVPGQYEEAPALLGGQRKAKRWDPAVLETPRPPVVLRRLHVSMGAHCGGRGSSRGQVRALDTLCLRECPVHQCPLPQEAGTAEDSCDHHERFCSITLCWVVDRKFPLAFPGLILGGAQAAGRRGRGQAAAIPTQNRSSRGLCGQVEGAGPAQLVRRPAGWGVAGHQSVPTL